MAPFVCISIRLHTVLTFFSPFRIFEQLALALKNNWVCPEIFHCIESIFLPFRIFEQLALALKSRVCPEIVHCIKYTFYIQDFWAPCAWPEKQSYLKFFTVLKYFLSFKIFEQLALALKTEFTLKCFKSGLRQPFPLPRLVRLWMGGTRKATPWQGPGSGIRV